MKTQSHKKTPIIWLLILLSLVFVVFLILRSPSKLGPDACTHANPIWDAQTQTCLAENTIGKLTQKEDENTVLMDIYRQTVEYVRATQKTALIGKKITNQELLETRYDGRALLIAHYPLIGNAEADKVIKNFLNSVVEKFRLTAKQQEQDFQSYSQKMDTVPTSLMTTQTLSFEVPRISDALKVIHFIGGENTGGSSNSYNTVLMFDTTGYWIGPQDMFTNPISALNSIAENVQAQLLAKAKASEADNPEAYERLKSMILNGSAPRPENYASIGFDQDNLIVYFDKYQVGPGSDGLTTVKIPLKDVRRLLKPEFLKLLDT